MLLRISSIALTVLLAGQCHLAIAQNSQERLSVTKVSISQFRQLSVRVLSAYKIPPRYIGSTEQWHLFLKKETRNAVGKKFSTIFGYKIPRNHSSVEHGWDIQLPTASIDPDNCPKVSHYNSDKSGFSLPPAKETASRCIDR
ncbi:hypothetical protein EH243_14840 [Amphritea opalescens]|uniref:Uncharacterized protein n=1 Tax=Amphritea opalescens TaxID=2490544 RepID=A0A430KN74_9GAMM|nr:hypothetical protein [Amphritea opalescens]RTE64947.1 hypothetical protein EH243_14840 [Amphritea opalescens]